MKALIDTNIYLDIALQRPTLMQGSLAVFEHSANSSTPLLLSPHSLATISYMSEKVLGKKHALNLVEQLLALVEIAHFKHADAVLALDLNGPDFEDSLVIATAMSNEAECIITRNGKDFKHSPITVFSPEAYLRHVQ